MKRIYFVHLPEKLKVCRNRKKIRTPLRSTHTTDECILPIVYSEVIESFGGKVFLQQTIEGRVVISPRNGDIYCRMVDILHRLK